MRQNPPARPRLGADRRDDRPRRDVRVVCDRELVPDALQVDERLDRVGVVGVVVSRFPADTEPPVRRLRDANRRVASARLACKPDSLLVLGVEQEAAMMKAESKERITQPGIPPAPPARW